jgi:hypothetical protein
MFRQGFLIAGTVPKTWAVLYQSTFWGGRTRESFLSGAGLLALLPSLLLVGLVVLLDRRAGSGSAFDAPLFAGLGLLGLAFPGNLETQALVPLALALFVVFLARSFSAGALRAEAPLVAAGVAMLPAAARQPFSMLKDSPYTAFSAPLALVVVFTLLARSARRPRRIFLFAASLAAAGAVKSFVWLHRSPRETVATVRGSLTLLVPEARLLRESVDALRRATRPGAYVATFPDSALVTFLAERRSPFVDDQFLPQMQDARAEGEMVRQLDTRPVAAALIANRSLREFGVARFGEGYDEVLMRGIADRMRLVAVLGAPLTERPEGLRANQALLYLRRDAP